MLMLFIGYELIIIGCCLVFHESMDVILGGVDMILAHRKKRRCGSAYAGVHP